MPFAGLPPYAKLPPNEQETRSEELSCSGALRICARLERDLNEFATHFVPRFHSVPLLMP